MHKLSRFWQILVVASVITLFGSAVSAKSKMVINPAVSPIGTWWQIDEHTHRARSIIQVYADKEHPGYLVGKIVKAFPHDGHPAKTVCDLCGGKLHNAPIAGLQIMYHFRQIGVHKWGQGKILDPSSGEIYSCQLTLLNGGKYLKVRGYVGISLFGRTQIWLRKQ